MEFGGEEEKEDDLEIDLVSITIFFIPPPCILITLLFIIDLKALINCKHNDKKLLLV
jgi:hypothetical protein